MALRLWWHLGHTFMQLGSKGQVGCVEGMYAHPSQPVSHHMRNDLITYLLPPCPAVVHCRGSLM